MAFHSRSVIIYSVRSSSTLVIAEVGVNHNGDVDLAHRLIDAAATAGADVVKFQTFDPQLVVSATGRTARYQLQSTGQRTQQEMLAALSLPMDAWVDLAEHCRQLEVEFLSTAFDWQSLEMLLQIGLRRIKIPSGEIDNVRFIARASECGLPLVISTGMSDWGDVDLAVAASTSAPDITLLHCVSLYPTPPELTNLAVIPSMRDRYHLPIGWSDHTPGTQAAVIAVALGATVIEKHITLDRSMPGPDHLASSDPEQFATFVSAIRLTESMLGTPDKRPQPGEREVAVAARRSHHATRDLQAGQTLQTSDTQLLRPADGAPAAWDLTGRMLTREVRRGEAIETHFLAPAEVSDRAIAEPAKQEEVS